MEKSIFNEKALLSMKKRLEESPTRYYIGVDSYSDNRESSYCLGYWDENTFRIVLAKTERNKDSFMEEVNNLMKYFNAVKIKEK